jgi:hypothetical protein
MLHWGCFWGLWGSGPDPLLRLKSLRSNPRTVGPKFFVFFKSEKRLGVKGR